MKGQENNYLFLEWFHQKDCNLLSCPRLRDEDTATVPAVLHYPLGDAITNS